ncbi:uncharacterized protein F4822DRAFT_424069 [Hypoxylon trugodes]|uniref:uncharacterized protein n=1 Tax=Hypoxylon trugodes TaxID=326681 RepID=UPI00219B9CB2|nr:uncharacterized protein F4822DRAFT_424069 [Hypoxylon trugodes]KAI1393599.1 hypothetical protein F4822DRAFT_424069 [Hypoxylon trugodes]
MQALLIISLAISYAVARPSFLQDAISDRAVIDKPVELAQFQLEPFNLTNMHVECNKGNKSPPMFGCSINFNWDDPNANQSCTCQDYWQWDGITRTQGPTNNYSTEYLVCKDNRFGMFQFKFVDIFDLSNFSLSLTHMYKDNKNFPTPTIANMFSQPNISLQLTEKSNTMMRYSSACHCPIEADITGMTI